MSASQNLDQPDLRVTLDRSFFFSGEPILGIVAVELFRPLRCSKVIATFSGEESAAGIPSRALFRTRSAILEGPGSHRRPRGLLRRLFHSHNETLLPAGQYLYDLHVETPQFLPPSLQCRFDLAINYNLKVSVHDLRAPVAEIQIPVRILGSQLCPSLLQSLSRPVDCHRRIGQRLGGLFGGSSVSARMDLRSQLFRIGGPIGGTVDVRNRSKNPLSNLRIALVRRIRCKTLVSGSPRRRKRLWAEGRTVLAQRILAETISGKKDPVAGAHVCLEFALFCPPQRLVESVFSSLAFESLSPRNLRKFRNEMKRVALTRSIGVSHCVELSATGCPSGSVLISVPVHFFYEQRRDGQASVPLGPVSLVDELAEEASALANHSNRVVDDGGVPDASAGSAEGMEEQQMAEEDTDSAVAYCSAASVSGQPIPRLQLPSSKNGLVSVGLWEFLNDQNATGDGHNDDGEFE